LRDYILTFPYQVNLPPIHPIHFIRIIAFALATSITSVGLLAQDTNQLGFSELQARANKFVEGNQLVEARPLLKELIQRVEKTEKAEIELDLPIFLVATSYIQEYLTTGNTSLLKNTITWFDKLEKYNPNSRRLKEALIKKIDVFRILGQNDSALKLMQTILNDGRFRLSIAEESKLLKDITETYYGTGQLEAGRPFFLRLLGVSRDSEDSALAAAASFEAYTDAGELDQAMKTLPYLVQETSIRYRPRLNVALLKASDIFVDSDRLNDATLVLNLIKTTGMIVEYYEDQIATKKSTLDQRKAFNANADVLAQLEREISSLESNLESIRQLPSLESDLLVRRARNYTKSERIYEAFWMFSDLAKSNPSDPQIQYYYYAAFSNALKINKSDAIVSLGKDYRSNFPDGTYYSDVSIALANKYRQDGNFSEFLEIAETFLAERPIDPVSGNFYAQWASHLLEQGEFKRVIDQSAEWISAHDTSLYADGANYWPGQANMMLSSFNEAAASFDKVLQDFPNSSYAEDSLLRKGTALFYAQNPEESRQALNMFLDQYPNSASVDLAYYFLGEVETNEGNAPLAIELFEKADAITFKQDIHDAIAFRLGGIYESSEQYKNMIKVYQDYIEKYGSEGRLTDAVFELGRGYEYLNNPTGALTLYVEYINKFIADEKNTGVDTLIESYAGKYVSNLKILERTVSFIDRLESDLDFRTKIVSDRGFLFEHFYENEDINQSLYNDLRNSPGFGPDLILDLTPINDLLQPFKDELNSYPSVTPETYFRKLLDQGIASNQKITTLRALMGLYRLNIELKPSEPFDSDDLELATPRLLLYIADYERDKRLEFAVTAWNKVLSEYAFDDSAIVALLRLSDVSEGRGDISLALNYLENILTQFPGSPKTPAVILKQGELLTSIGKTKEAREKYQYILKVPAWRGALHARALYQTGTSYMVDSAYPEAHGFFERTFLGYSQISEWAARAYLADAEALVKMGSTADAISTLNEAIELLNESASADLMTSIKAKLRELQS